MARIEEIRVDPWHPWFVFFLGCGFAAPGVRGAGDTPLDRLQPLRRGEGRFPSEETDVRCEIFRGCKAALGGSDYNYMSPADIPPEILQRELETAPHH